MAAPEQHRAAALGPGGGRAAGRGENSEPLKPQPFDVVAKTILETEHLCSGCHSSLKRNRTVRAHPARTQ